ncbi:MAG: hypothetical protein KIS66_16200 [Fimbriimonadaceae bacterium]|nr:hypothetical protein [Fimbriimonadaceae bacterium]
MKSPSLDVETLVRTLAEAGVRYVLIGGFALAAHGGDNLTTDLDLALAFDDQNLDRAAEALNALGPTLRGAPVRLDRFAFDGAFVRYRTAAGEIDIINRLAPVGGFEGLWERSEVLRLYGRDVRIASLQDLLRLKEASARPKDALHVETIRALMRLGDEG